ncbi:MULTISPECIES: ABC transporter permease [Paenibacillus]|uniref:Glutathione ABC transporter permease n=1 Tax=Paenibacillus naphthalenovorans TaxID=162209 RepID=A0A0U2M1T3_9BACL|nr:MULTISPECIES: ABC transporter permease [Paenibacillus]ALS21104.1 glutathione ABC transporter permease [Paenibacillus naphthalenovorans]SDJ86539.1 peptide/nickel transport system permease protein [Paenibacillus naphthalenovorans]
MQAIRKERRSTWHLVLALFYRNKVAMTAAAVILLITVASLLAPWIAPYPPNDGDGSLRLAPPGTPGHLLGLDDQGRDILSRLLWGGRLSLISAVVPVVISAVISLLLGIVAGYYRGFIGETIMRVLDIFFAFPAVLLSIAITAILGTGLFNVMLAMVIVRIPYMTRVVYTDTVIECQKEYIESAIALGAGGMHVLFRQLLPNVLTSLVVYATTLTGVTIITIAGLSFFGLGVQPPDADWGRMTSDGRTVLMQGAPHVTLFPGLMILIVSLAFSLLGDGLRDALDPQRITAASGKKRRMVSTVE